MAVAYLTKMLGDRHSHNLTESYRHRVANHSPDGAEAVFATQWYEFVVLRERLENRTFAQRDGAVLFRVAEAAVAETEELRGDGGRGFVPLHAAIDAGVGLAGFDLVTLGDEFARPVAPGAAGPGAADAAEIERREFAGAVERIGGRYVARCERRKGTQYIANFTVLGGRVRGRDEFNGAEA